eukprot:gene11588-4831_t
MKKVEVLDPHVLLPTEMLTVISEFLDVSSYNNLSLTNKQWNNTCFNNTVFWKSAFFTTNNFSKSHSQTWREAYVHYHLYMNLLREKQEKLVTALEFPCSTDEYATDDEERDLISQIKTKISVKLDLAIENYLKSKALFAEEKIDELYIKKAFFRYEKFLELKEKYPNLILIPTQDIEIIWFSHLLRPSKYHKDCKKYFKKLIDHKLCLTDYEISVKLDCVKKTKDLWENEFQIPYYKEIQNLEKYKLDFELSSRNTIMVDLRDSTAFEVCKGIHDFNLNSNFQCKFSITNEDIKKDLSSNAKPLVKSYFESSYFAFWDIIIKNKQNVKDYSPDHQIDAFWHSHMLHPVEYKKNCLNSFGFVLDHHVNESKFVVEAKRGKYNEFNLKLTPQK